ncbi:MAG: ABC transporter ATP-binding protein [bacterium]
MKRGLREVLRDVDFAAPADQITVLFGPSGVGKTTCLRLIAGFEYPSAGEVILGGEIVSSPSRPAPPRNRRVGFCFQEDALWPALKARDHIQLPLRTLLGNREDIRRRSEWILENLGLASCADRYPAQLSGGEKKRLGLARALALEPAYLLLDEPLSSVEGPMRDELIRLLRGCRKGRRAILMVTHQLDEALALADRLVVLLDGHVAREGLIQEVIRDPRDRDAARLLGYRNFFTVRVENGTLLSPFGRWPAGAAADRSLTEGDEKIAAAFPGDFQARPDDQGRAVIQDCRTDSRACRVQALQDGVGYEATAATYIESGRRAALRCIHPPAILEDPPV